MEKSKPHYRLSEIQGEVARRGAASFTKTALKNGLAMGLTTGRLVDGVRGLVRGNFIKSMTTHRNYTFWQDVYHAQTPAGPGSWPTSRSAAMRMDRRPRFSSRRKTNEPNLPTMCR
jgi:motility quorum-sensing regulator / GCU-specific mRNA interferase toxin